MYAPSETRHWPPFPVPDAMPTPAAPVPRSGGRGGQLVAGRYRLKGTLGRGGMGNVWLALDEALLRSVAIKEFTLADEVIDSTAASARVLAEARAAAQVNHPGVVRIYDLAVQDGRLWIVMEPLSGRTLAQAIREQGQMDPEWVADIALHLLDALSALHLAGVIHRDVKPSNVQLTADNRAVLIDFGLAARDGTAPPIEAGQIVGSPPYMAPESIRAGAFGPASDLFSLGATLYAAVEGRQPFDGLSAFSTLQAVQYDTLPPARHAGCLRPLINGLLAKDPDERLGLSEALACVNGSKRPEKRSPSARHGYPPPW